MAPRFLILISDNAPALPQQVLDDAAKASSLRLQKCLKTCHLFHSTDAPCLHIEGSGFVLGNLFRSGDTRVVRQVTAQEQQRIQTLGASYLKSSFWGGYVSLLIDEETGGCSIFRDPSGALPFYFHWKDGVLIGASDIETLYKTSWVKPEVDWRKVAERLVRPSLKQEATLLKDVFELRPGFQLRLTSEGLKTRCLWSPWDFVTTAPPTFEDATARVRAAVETATRAWSGLYQNPLLGVSGGLDSSILASILAKRDASWSMNTCHTNDAGGDERHYARKLAEHLQKQLHENPYDIRHVNVCKPTTPHLPRPLGHLIGQSHEQINMELADRLGTDAFFTGQGGDNVFCLLQSATPFVDRFLTHGVSSGAWRTLGDLCDLTGCSLGEAGWLAFHRLRRRDPTYLWRDNGRFLSRDIEPLSSADHPWLSPPPGALPGQAVHVAMLLKIQATVEGFSRYRAAPLVTPLISQPVMEACLGIPSWIWCQGGRDRAVARAAFRDALPRAIVERRSKGGPDSFCVEVIETHRKPIRTNLTEGLLASHGLLNATEIYEGLSSARPLKFPDHGRYAQLMEMENWTRHWSAKQRAARPIDIGALLRQGEHA